MGTPTLLDSNIAIYLIKGGLTETVRESLRTATLSGFNLSVITQIELLGYVFPTSTEKIQTEKLVAASAVFALTDEIVNQTIVLRRLYKIKLPDAIIAATALVHGFTLVSRNDKDFSSISGLNYLNPFGS